MASEPKKRRKIENSVERKATVCSMQMTPICDEERREPGEITIMDLNDDCLREICDYLNLQDLCSFADVCSRFKQNARAKFRQLDMQEINKDVWTELPDIAKYRMLRNFGLSITSLVAVALKRNNEYIVLMIIRYCGEALKSLTLQSFRINAYLGDRLLSVIPRLEKFGMIDCNCQTSFSEKLSSNSPNLRELKCKFSDGCSDIFVTSGVPHIFPKLETVSIFDLNYRSLEAFLIKNQQIKSIQMESAKGNENNFALIAQHLPTLESLGIVISKSWNMGKHTNLRKMNALKNLRLKSHRSTKVAPILKIMARNERPIENLELIECPFNSDLAAVIPMFQNIKVLRLIEVKGIKIWDIVDWCQALKQLTELQYRVDGRYSPIALLAIIRCSKRLRTFHFENKLGKMTVNAEIFMRIVDVVKARKNDVKPLEIVLVGKNHQIDVGKELMNANREVLTLEIKRNWQEIEFGFPVDEDLVHRRDFDFNFDFNFESAMHQQLPIKWQYYRRL